MWLLGKAYGSGEVGMKKRGRMPGRPARAGSFIEGPTRLKKSSDSILRATGIYSWILNSGVTSKVCVSSKMVLGASLVAQWLRVCLPMRGTRVRALVWEDPTCRGATGPVSHGC